jgi:hypothetical protein
MSAYQAARAAEILGIESLPDRLTVEQIAILQIVDQLPRDPIAWVCRRVTEGDRWCKAMRAAIDAGELRQADGNNETELRKPTVASLPPNWRHWPSTT